MSEGDEGREVLTALDVRGCVDRVTAGSVRCGRRAPRSASNKAVASPIPLLAPVIATTMPLISDMSSPREGPQDEWVGAVRADQSRETQHWQWPGLPQ